MQISVQQFQWFGSNMACLEKGSFCLTFGIFVCVGGGGGGHVTRPCTSTPQKLMMICAGIVFLLQIDQVQEVLEKGIEAEMVMHRYSVVREAHLFSSDGWNLYKILQ